jgi:hypothetical protein
MLYQEKSGNPEREQTEMKLASTIFTCSNVCTLIKGRWCVADEVRPVSHNVFIYVLGRIFISR